MVVRSVIGCFALVSFSLGAALAPLSVQLSVGNLAPFFAGIFAYIMVGEQMAAVEILAMFVSFGGVVLVALGTEAASAEHQDRELPFNMS